MTALAPTARPQSWPLTLLVLALVVVALLSAPGANAATETLYNNGNSVDVWANKIVPFSSPTESYEFYDLPWCRPPSIEHRKLKLGETLAGDHIVKSMYNITYRHSMSTTEICEKFLKPSQVDQFIKAIKERYVYELQIDSLPMKLFVGEINHDQKPEHIFIYTHVEFSISVNGPHVILAEATPGKSVELKAGEGDKLRFTYSVRWKDTDFPAHRRAEKYKDPLHSRDVDIHWFSIGNATLSVLLLMGLFGSILLRVVKKDFKEYEDIDGDDEADDYGWKLLHGDVFRFPRFLTLLCPLLGAGAQLLTLSAILLVLGALEFFHPLSKGAIYSSGVLSYALTSGIAGFVSGYYYKQMGGSKWMRNAIITVFIFFGPAVLTFAYLNTIAVLYGSTRALPAWAIAIIVTLWLTVTVPLSLLGAIVGKNQSRPFNTPGRIAKIAREIPHNWWYRKPLTVAVICGLMPFSSIYVEVYFMFGAIWGHKIFQVYEMLAIVFTMLMIVTTITTVSAVYFQLTMENYLWAWASVFYGGSIGLYLMAYSVFYYFVASPFSGFLQASYFFGYMFLISYAFFIMCGTTGFFSARKFVRFLYASVKND